jgi:hypothetical protein
MKEGSEALQLVVEEDEVEVTKMLGAHVSKELYWKFKGAAAERGEQLKDAVAHAARMYIDAVPKR